MLKLDIPIAFATALLLGGGWVSASIACFGEVAWEVLLGSGGTIGKAYMVTVVGLVSASHCSTQSLAIVRWED